MAVVSNLADVHEAEHAGTALGGSGAATLLVNRCHWAGVSCVGAAHVIENQDIPFDAQRVVLVRDKFFAPYLAAQIQWMYGEQESARLSSLVVPESGALSKNGTGELLRGWSQFLAFDGQCNHTDVSERA